MEEAGKNVAAGGDGHPGVRPVIQGGNTGVFYVWVGVLGSVLHDDEGGIGNSCGVSKKYHQEAGTASDQRELGDYVGGGGPTDGGNAVGS